jgi:LasA protease
MKLKKIYLSLFVFALLLSSCVRPQTNMDAMWAPVNASATEPAPQAADPQVLPPAATAPPGTTPSKPTVLVPTRIAPTLPNVFPTPDPAHIVPTLRSNPVNYTVKAGDSLAVIARRYGVDVNSIASANSISNPDLVKVNQALVIPPPSPKFAAPSFKIIPDSELVFSPLTRDFDIRSFVHSMKGYLDSYREEVDGQTLSGADIVDLVSREHSVNPRILLAVLEFQGGWVTNPSPQAPFVDYPMGWMDRSRKGLYKQIFWAANNLDRGYYDWQSGSVGSWVLSDSTIVPVSPVVNAGTAAIQYLMSLLKDQGSWTQSVSKDGVFASFNQLFGYPFNYTYEPLVPADLTQPKLQLPFETGVMWYFTGGPHMGWDDGSAWAALDFAPTDGGTCAVSEAWETAVADGVIVRSGDGSVILDLDGDGYEQTGWTILYLHVATQDRIAAGTKVHAGDRIGHPSCEGGYSPAMHLHIARRYNGVWIPADGPTPFVMDGWVAESTGTEYDGYLKNNGQVVEAWNSRKEENQIQR